MLDGRYICKLSGDFFQVFESQLWVCDFASAEAHRYPHLDAVKKPPPCITNFERAVMLVGFWAQADLFDLDFCLGLSGFTVFLRPLINELTDIHHPAYGWFGIRGDLDQVQLSIAGDAQGLLSRDYADVLTVRTDQTDFLSLDGLIDPKIC